MDINWKNHMGFVNFLDEYFDLEKLKSESDIEYDLGMTGDDAEIFMKEYSKKFNVNLEGLDIYQYFHSEGANTLYLLKKYFLRKKGKKKSR